MNITIGCSFHQTFTVFHQRSSCRSAWKSLNFCRTRSRVACRSLLCGRRFPARFPQERSCNGKEFITGKHTKSYRKTQFLMGKSTIKLPFIVSFSFDFPHFLYVYQRVITGYTAQMTIVCRKWMDMIFNQCFNIFKQSHMIIEYHTWTVDDKNDLSYQRYRNPVAPVRMKHTRSSRAPICVILLHPPCLLGGD